MKAQIGKRAIALSMAIAALSIAIVDASLAELTISRKMADVVYNGKRLSAMSSVEAALVEQYAYAAEAAVAGGVCRAEVVHAGIVPIMLAVDITNPDVNYVAWARALERAETYMNASLRCLPTSGDIWLRMAMIKQAIGENPQVIASLLALSQYFSPSEGELVFARLSLWNRVEQPTIDRGKETLEKDIRAACLDPTRMKQIAFTDTMKATLTEIAPQKCGAVLR
jgi:hypothetical protein